MKHINPFKIETDKHRSPMARREQLWKWMVKRINGASKEDFVGEGLAMRLFTRKNENEKHHTV